MVVKPAFCQAIELVLYVYDGNDCVGGNVIGNAPGQVAAVQFW